MPTLFEIRSASAVYTVSTERRLLDTLQSRVGKGVVIADCYFSNALAERGVNAIELPGDESSKGLDALQAVIIAMRDAGADRDTRLWAIGGGAIQDTAAFAASIYMRGIAWTYIPTTLLSMVDSCVGGKSSINVGSYKNLVGTFHVPTAVLIDASLTASLSSSQRVAGLIEAAKICFCRSEADFDRYLALDPDAALKSADFESIISLSLSAKKWFIEVDEFDRGERLLLNFGHTYGHALEGASAFRIGHGVAVGVGMLCGIALSASRNSGSQVDTVQSLERHIRALLSEVDGLSEILHSIDIADVMERFGADKKHDATHYRLVTLDECGRPTLLRLPKTEGTRSAVETSISVTFGTLHS